MSEPSVEQKAVASLLRRLDVRRETEAGNGGAEGTHGTDGVRGTNGVPATSEFVADASRQPGPRLFGGLVAGQAVVAAARTVPGLTLHSLHAYFLQPGDPELAVRYRVQHLKDGKNFHARHVTGHQGDRVIFSMQASFVRPEPGIEHQDPMPEAPAPESTGDSGFGFWGASSPVQLRDCDGSFERAAERGHRRMWIRPASELPEDPTIHLGMLVFASDMTFVMTGLLPHVELRRRPRGGASLDHAMWFHRAPRFDDWLLYTMQTPAAHDGRPLITGTMYRRDGTRVATVAQEGLIRLR